ncbi:PTS sugar transporter subunit IIA [Lentibacillus sp.]|uniref:PTS sugar transporter subunit IIA n=1 Tax=Lentibacillus sp. TaxID=1925746 RepID=UPI002B4B5AEE|nr:PTS sugar transporter subunit IIA [Lentibacillus sp.]HLS09616.1 PTS sugar transporter subunit IIA [Lentibacillus sp.]
MINKIFNMNNIVFDSSVKTKDEALNYIAAFAEQQGVVKSPKAYYKGLKKREKEVTTGFKDGVAIPHCKHKTVISPSLMLVKFSNPVEWESMDGKAVEVAFALAIPDGKNNEHLKLLSTLSRALIDEQFTQSILTADIEKDLYYIIQNKLEELSD